MVILSAASDMGATERFSKMSLQRAGSPFFILAGMIRASVRYIAGIWRSYI
jgi:hypothetical protein